MSRSSAHGSRCRRGDHRFLERFTLGTTSIRARSALLTDSGVVKTSATSSSRRTWIILFLRAPPAKRLGLAVP